MDAGASVKQEARAEESEATVCRMYLIITLLFSILRLASKTTILKQFYSVKLKLY
jgi:hypothetical protein